MRSIYIGLVAAFCWTGALSASPAAEHGDADMAVMAGRRRLARNNGRSRFASSGFAELGLRQSDAQCGPQYGKCPGDLCCSSYGFCGDSIDHCHPLFDCQTQYGTCGWPRAAPQPSTTSTSTTSTRSSTSSTPTTTSTSTSTSTTTTSTPVTPPTTTTTTTTRPSTTSTSTIPIPTGSLQITTNGMCGNNTMCIGNPNFGPCCSQFFWCGSTLDYCGAGCRSEFGACFGVPGLPGNPATNGTTTTSPPASTSTTTRPPSSSSTTTTTSPPASTTSTSTTRSSTTSTSSSAAPSFTLPPGQRSSTDGRCGDGVNCLGSNFGRCCSQFGYCGDGDQFCPYIVGCQPEFGYCDPQ